MRTLIVIDMQNDFVFGALGSKEAVSILPNVKRKIDEYISAGYEVIFTRDTHSENYLNTNEGRHLPILHCIRGTKGWEIVEQVDVSECKHVDKTTFGYTWDGFRFEDCVELVGVCTDICVISNALVLKALFPEIEITVDARCCAGVTPESHMAALTVMKSCQINITEASI